MMKKLFISYKIISKSYQGGTLEVINYMSPSLTQHGRGSNFGSGRVQRQ